MSASAIDLSVPATRTSPSSSTRSVSAASSRSAATLIAFSRTLWAARSAEEHSSEKQVSRAFLFPCPRPAGELLEETSTRPVGRCLTSVYLQYWRASSGTHFAAWCPLCSVALSGQAPTPHSGARKARGLTVKARTERSSVCRDVRGYPTLSERSSTNFYSSGQRDRERHTTPLVPLRPADDWLRNCLRRADSGMMRYAKEWLEWRAVSPIRLQDLHQVRGENDGVIVPWDAVHR